MGSNSYNFQVRSYKRSFKKPLVTSQCVLNEREGLIVRLQDDDGNVGFGEIAPMPFLGSESFEDAKVFCSQIGPRITNDWIASINPTLPCCRFGILSAQEMLKQPIQIQRQFEVAALVSLTSTEAALSHYKDYKTFKCKIGIFGFDQEKTAFLEFQASIPQGAQLRLDANGALSLEDTKNWLRFLDNLDNRNVQFLEQPLPKGQEALMAELADDYQTPIALDESVINCDDFQKNLDKKWPGWLVIKPSLIGDIDKFRQLRSNCDRPIVYSSVFETAIGIEAGLALAANDLKNHYALGFGTIDYFLEDGLSFHQNGSHIDSGKITINNFEEIWELCNTII